MRSTNVIRPHSSSHVTRIIPPIIVVLLLVVSVFSLQSSNAASPMPDAEKSFAAMKNLAGTWQGLLTTVPEFPDIKGNIATITLKVTSRGHAIMHEMTHTMMPDDPITMIYLDGQKLFATHYCDAGNRPRMEGKLSADGKIVQFDFVDLSGSNENGHMHNVVFTPIDANHHTEDWTFMLPGDKSVRAHFDLKRIK